MQILIVTLFIILIIGFIIYKIDGKFGKKEMMILASVIIVTLLVFMMYQKNQMEYLPKAFEQQYKKVNNIEILKLSSERLNNKNLSSKKKFIYSFTYLINKNQKEFLCTANPVIINRIDDTYVFEKWTEECQEQ